MLPGTKPEVFYSTLPPEVVNAGVSDNVERSQDSVVGDKPSRKRTKWSFSYLALVVVVVVVAALAIGLGFGLRKKKKPSSSAPISSSPTTAMCVSLIPEPSIVLTMQALLSSTIHLLRLSFRPIVIDICSSRVLKVLYVE